jgi:hypothetical protein
MISRHIVPQVGVAPERQAMLALIGPCQAGRTALASENGHRCYPTETN